MPEQLPNSVGRADLQVSKSVLLPRERPRPQAMLTSWPPISLRLPSAEAAVIQAAPVQPIPSGEPRLELEEYFDGVVVEDSGESLQLRTRSSRGEEAVASLPKANIPESERPYIALGAPVRISILVQNEPRKRYSEVRFLRPHQWYRPEDEADTVSDLIYRRMREILDRP